MASNKKRRNKSRNRHSETAIPSNRNQISQEVVEATNGKRSSKWNLLKLPGAKIVAWLGLTVSVAVGAFAIWGPLEQKRQWESTSIGNVVLDDAGFSSWKNYSDEAFQECGFGYEASIERREGGGRAFENKYHLVSRLVLRKTNDHKYADEVIWAYTMNELVDKFRKKGLDVEDGYVIKKEYLLKVSFKKLGTTPARRLTIFVEVVNPPEGEWLADLDEKSSPIDLFASDKHGIKFMLRQIVEAEEIQSIKLRINIEYVEADGTLRKYTIPYEFNRSLMTVPSPTSIENNNNGM